MNLIWATRGRTWGFRFLRSGGFTDPLPIYESAFAGAEDLPKVCLRGGETLALRFPDPLNRRDAAGRVISHDVVVFGGAAVNVHSVEEGRDLVWPLISGEFDIVWNRTTPPTSAN